MAIKENTENLVLIVTRYQTILNKDIVKPLEEIELDDIWPVFNTTIANADVVIIKEKKRFKVLKHKHMELRHFARVYHESSLKNICFARS